MDASARGSDARRDRGGHPSVLVRGAREDSALGLCYRSGFCRLPSCARHHPRHCRDDFSQLADVPCVDWLGHLLRRLSRVSARALQSASGHDRGLGIVGRRGDGDGADVRRLRRRHAARRRHAISAGRLRRTGGVACRSGMGAAGRRGRRIDHLVSARCARSFFGDAALGRGWRNRRGQIQDSRRRPAGADVHRRAALRQRIL